jgi:hypothetical protein
VEISGKKEVILIEKKRLVRKFTFIKRRRLREVKRKFVYVLLAMMLALSLSLVTALPAAADPDTLNVYPLTLGIKNSDSIAEWSTTQPHTGSYSAHLDSGTTTAGDGDEARIVVEMPEGTTLNDITSISWWEYNVAGYPPHVDVKVDTDDNGEADDALVFEYAYNGETHYTDEAPMPYGALTGAWYQTFSDDGNGPSVIDNDANAWLNSGPAGPLGGESFIYGTLAEWKAGTVDESVDGDTAVTALEIEVDNWVVNSEAYVDDIAINGVIWYGRIQDAIDCAEPGDTISVAAGTYEEDLSIPEGKDNLELVGASGATIKGVAMVAADDWPLADPNIDILADGVKISGFTIEGPDYVADYYSSGIVLDGVNIEIYDNDFVTTTAETVDELAHAITTYSKTVFADADVSGLNIHDNTFTGDGATGSEFIYINPHTGTGAITIDSNEFGGAVYVGATVESGEVSFTNNTVINEVESSGLYGVRFMDTTYEANYANIVVSGNDIENFQKAVRVGNGGAGDSVFTAVIDLNTLTDNDVGIWGRLGNHITAINNSIDGNTVGVQNDDATVTINAQYNYWGSASGPTHESNTFNVEDQGDAVSDNVDYVPWYDTDMTGSSFAPVNSEDGPFSSIQAAIEAATSTTITCAAGTYDESPYIYKSLTLQSEEGAEVTNIDGYVEIELGLDGEDPLDETVVIDGFTVDPDDWLAIWLYEVNNGSSATINDCILKYANYGIYCGMDTLDNGSTVTITGNEIYGCNLKGIWFEFMRGGSQVTITGNEIYECNKGIWFSEVTGGSTLTIRDNEVFSNECGIYIDDVDASTVNIEDNLVADNGYGIEFDDVDESTVTIAGNTIGEGYSECEDEMLSGNYRGIYFIGEDTVSNSTITIAGNTITYNGQDGIYISTIIDSTVTIGGETEAEANIISNNGEGEGHGICVEYMEASSLYILNNDILDNGGITTGMYIYADEYSSVDIHLNSIVGNSGYGVYNDSDDDIVFDATCNWWGDIAGPSIHTNPCYWTSGDAVSSDVDYKPWLIQSDLAEGWNIWSPPIAPDEDSWLQMQADLTEAGVEAVYYFDSETQYWGADPDDAGPLDAYYIKMSDDARIRYCISSEATFPGQKAMKVGWNLVGLAQLYDMYVYDALYDAYYGTGQTELVGYSKVISPSLNGNYWIYQRGDERPPMYPTMGYWVFMVNDGTLGGFTETPIGEAEIGP